RAAAPVLVVANTARRDEIFFAVYDTTPEGAVRRGAVRAVWPADLAAGLNELGPDARVVGDGVAQLDAAACPGEDRIVSRDPAPSPAAVGTLGRQRLLADPAGEDVRALQPLYPRRDGVHMPVLGEPVERER
ncbi:MAG: hypothetical protein ACOCX4_10025, partial [Planctomycetota bacterium]